MSRPRFDVGGLWEHDPAPQNRDQGHGPTQSPSRTVQVAPPPRPTHRTSQKQAPAYRPMPSPARPPQPAQRAESRSDSDGWMTARSTTVYAPPALAPWLREQANGFVNPIWPHCDVLKWPHPVMGASVSMIDIAWSSGWPVEVGLVTFVAPFVTWVGSVGWAAQIRSAPSLVVMSWAFGAAPLWRGPVVRSR